MKYGINKLFSLGKKKKHIRRSFRYNLDESVGVERFVDSMIRLNGYEDTPAVRKKLRRIGGSSILF